MNELRGGNKKRVKEERRKRVENLTGKILRFLLVSGAIGIALASPYGASKLIDSVFASLFNDDSRRDTEKKTKLRNAFYYLKNKGFIEMDNRNGQLFIALTEEGKRMAGRYQINDLKIRKEKRWDKKWRILIFDIADKHKVKREALRGKLKELGFYQLQKSVWVYPYDFEREAILLRDFFGLDVKEMTIITEAKIEGSDDLVIFFNITG